MTRLWDRLVFIRNGQHVPRVRVAGPDARPWRVTVYRLEVGGYLARAQRDYGAGSGRFSSRYVESWWTYDASPTPREAVRVLRALVRRSMRRGTR